MALTKAFAENGNRKEVPQTTTDGSVSYDQGFGDFYALPPEQGGLFIDRTQFNQLMFDTTSAIIENNQSITQINNKFSSLETGGGSIVTVKPANTVLTVGTGGAFSTLESAWNEAKKYLGSVEIRLVSDILNDQNISLNSVNAKNVRINFNGFKLKNTNTSQAMTLTFAACVIDSLNNPSLEGYILAVINSSLVYITQNLTINNADYDGGDCVRVWYNAFCGINNNSQINLSHPNGNTGLFATTGSIIAIGGGSVITDNSVGGASCLRVFRGAIINAAEVTINSNPTPKANQAPNAVTQNGIIFGNYSL